VLNAAFGGGRMSRTESDTWFFIWGGRRVIQAEVIRDGKRTERGEETTELPAKRMSARAQASQRRTRHVRYKPCFVERAAGVPPPSCANGMRVVVRNHCRRYKGRAPARLKGVRVRCGAASVEPQAARIANAKSGVSATHSDGTAEV